MTESRVKVVGFDLDDTLWDMRPVLVRAERALADWLMSEVPGFDYDPGLMRRLREQVIAEDPDITGKVTELRRRILVRALAESHRGHASAEVLADSAMEVFLDARNHIELLDGAWDAIRALSARYVLGSLTNGNANIHRVGLGDHFDFAFTAEQVGAPKPDPALFEAALEHTSVDPHQMVYVGDDPNLDIDAAKRVGLKTVWVRRKSDQAPGETEPDAVISHLRDLPRVLREVDAGPT